ncbi:MAG: Gfo/Idh/MocA family oxidoreductase [Candidatus Acidiferrales bacterium]
MDRRTFIKRGSALVALSGAVAASGQAAQENIPESPFDTGEINNGKLRFPSEGSTIEGGAKFGGPPNQDPPDTRIGYAILGLGRLATEQIMPAFGRVKHAKLVALISGTPEKARVLAGEYGLPESKIYGYDDFNRIRDDQSIQAIYVVTPNALHHEHVLKCAAAGKHVLCEKPMSATAAEAEDMVAACAKADRKLMIGYRMQYEPHCREVIRMVRSGEAGNVKALTMFNGQNMGDPAQWRLRKVLAGGGAMYDIGVYCLNSARFVLGEEPIEINARIYTTPGDPRFKDVEESVYWTMLFPSGVMATCSTSYAMHNTKIFSVQSDIAVLSLEQAFSYSGLRLYQDRSIGGKGVIAELRIGDVDHFALELDHLALCIRDNVKPRTPGEEGLQDMKLIEAVYRSAASGQTVKLPRIDGLDTTRGPEPMPS